MATKKSESSIQKYVNMNEKLAAAESYAKGLSKGNAVAGWHEKCSKSARSGGTPASLGFGFGPAAGYSTSLSQAVAPDSNTAIKAIHTTRIARLKELYEREALMYEAELNELGLSLSRDRD